MNIHCVGIGGIGLSGLARLLSSAGHKVTGCDIENSEIIEELLDDSIDSTIGHSESHINSHIDLVIYSTAVPQSNVELQKARELNIKIKTYAEGLRDFTNDKFIIAITGTHGKTTTTAFTAITFIDGKTDPTVLIGSKLKELSNRNSRIGEGKYFIVEACEYQKNFLQFHPNVIILTNLEAEHLDYFKDLEDYKNAFKEFISQVRNGGYIIANYDDENVKNVVQNADKEIVYFSSQFKDEFKNLKNVIWYLKDNEIYRLDNNNNKHEYISDLELSVPGGFNKMNALGAFICAYKEKIENNIITSSLSKYTGSWRRMEEVGEFEEIPVISDYGHHPTEISVTLDALKEKYHTKRICCIYQPHQFNRTRHFLIQFPDAFKERTSFVIVPDIYKVRDSIDDISDVSDSSLVEAMKSKNVNALNIHSYEKIAEFIKENKSEIDLVVVMGAGDIYKLAYFLTD